MQKFSQKWVLVTFLEKVAEGREFFWTDWPLHVTIAPPFDVNWDDTNLHNKLTELFASYKPITVIANEEAYWGDNNETLVMKFSKNIKMNQLHTELAELIRINGGEFNDRHHMGKNYIPHATSQKHAHLHIGDVVNIHNVTLVDMFPAEDPYQRKVLKTFKFKSN